MRVEIQHSGFEWIYWANPNRWIPWYMHNYTDEVHENFRPYEDVYITLCTMFSFSAGEWKIPTTTTTWGIEVMDEWEGFGGSVAMKELR